jgi:arginine-tRNA-protein transferase
VNIYEGDQLVGAGFFDLGHESAMGIVSYYDPAYKPQGMGKFATMLAYDHCHRLGMKYFYPGYFAPGNPSFDYKLQFDPGSLEFLDMVKQQWLPLDAFRPQDLPLVKLHQNLLDLAGELDRYGLLTYHVHNIYYAFTETSKYDAPAVLMICPTEEQDRQYIVSYDHHTDEFHMYDCTEARCAEELRMYNGMMICMQHFPFQKPNLTLKRRDDVAANISGWLRLQQ